MLRAVLAVLLAAALLAVGAGAVEETRASRAGTLADGAAAQVASAVERLDRQAPPTERRATAPRRVLDLSLPTGTVRTAPASLVVGAGADGDGPGRDPLVTHVAGERRTTTWLPVELRAVGDDGLAPDDEPLVVGGDARVTLWLLAGADGPVVAVSRGAARG